MSNSPLVILPPFSADRASLDAVDLARVDPPPASVRVVRYPGHAGSARRPGVTFRDIADDVAAGLATGSGGAADVVGIGIGVHVVAELLLHHGDRVRSAVLVSASPVADPAVDRAAAEPLVTPAGGTPARIESTISRWFTAAAIRSGHVGVARARERLRGLDPAVWQDYREAVAGRRAPSGAELAGIEQPVTVVAPLHDPSPEPRRLTELAALLPLSRLMYVDGSRMILDERPEAVLAAIDSHLAWTAAEPQRVGGLYWNGA